jgi:CYTH domain-containing protein
MSPSPAPSANGLPIEIERKWLLSSLPPQAQHAPSVVLHQGYLPGEQLVERIRSVTDSAGTHWVRTVKLGRGISRIEVEEPADAPLGQALFALTAGKRVQKRRYTVADGDLAWEIDEFTDRNLVLAELELPHAEFAVTMPAWLVPCIVREVTDDIAFTNWRLAR